MAGQSFDGFYAQLPVLASFRDVANVDVFHAVPDDWCIVVADVMHSTEAVQRGLYREVNLLGAAVIVAVLNEARGFELPSIFGGDGASLCIPPTLLPHVRRALQSLKLTARHGFGLEYRMGLVPVAEVRSAGFDVHVCRFRTSDHFIQAAFTGGGLAHAEALIKDPVAGAPYRVEDDPGAGPPNLTGLECRWHDVPSSRGETVALLIKVIEKNPQVASKRYAEILGLIESIYGTERDCHPVDPAAMRFALRGSKLAPEIHAQTALRDRTAKLLYAVWIRMQVLIGMVVMRLGLRYGPIHWGDYKRIARDNTDFRKFDDMIRCVLAGTEAQRLALADALESRRRRGELVYGMHAAPSAVMTCMIRDYACHHVHFIDASNGGYTMAARQLKSQRESQG